MLDIVGITRSFGHFTVFDDVSLTVEPGTACAVVGANGSGKSTFLRCTVGADRPDRGRVLLDGAELDESAPVARRAVASVVDDVAMFPHLSVREHLSLVAVAHGSPDNQPDLEAIVDRVLAEMGLSSAADQLPITLSSGQRHRAALASTLVRPRRVLVLDEPEQHLDTAGRAALERILHREKADGTAVLIASHDSSVIESVADVVVDADAWR